MVCFALSGENGRYGVRAGAIEFADLTADREAVLRLIDALNELQPSPIHWQDIIEDFVQECAML